MAENEKVENYDIAVKEIKEAILRSQYQAAKGVNRVQLSLYYGIGRYISENSRKGFWGTEAIKAISDKLRAGLPGLRGFSAANIKFMRQFYEAWEPYFKSLTTVSDLTEQKTLTAVSENQENIIDTELLVPVEEKLGINLNEFLSLGFSLHMTIIRGTDDVEARLYYIHAAVKNCWSREVLKTKIEDDIYSHQGSLPNNFMDTIPEKQSALKAISVFKDEYLLDFINVEELNERDIQDVDEKVVENAVIHNIKNFMMTFGKDFAFVGNQYHLEKFGIDHWADLLFFNRELNALVVVDLKTGPFKPSYLGQLTTYLRLLDDNVKKPHENPSIGLILCKSANKDYVEYVIQDYDKPMGVATYKSIEDMPEKLRNALPDVEELRKLL